MPRKRRSNVQKAENASNQLKPRPVAIHESKTNPEETKPEIDVNPLHKKTEKSTDFKKVDSINANISSDIMGDIREEPSASTSMTEDLLSSSCKTRSGARGGNEHTKERLKETVRMSSNKEQAHKRKGSQREKCEQQALPHHSKDDEVQQSIPAGELEMEAEKTSSEKSEIEKNSEGVKKKQKNASNKPQFVEDEGFFFQLNELNSLLAETLKCRKCKTSKMKIILVDGEKSFAQKMALYCPTCKETMKQEPSCDRKNLPDQAMEDLDSTSESDISLDSTSESDISLDSTSESDSSSDLDAVSSSVGFSKGAKYLSKPKKSSKKKFKFSQASVTFLKKWEDNRPLIVDLIKRIYLESGEGPDEQGIVNIGAVYYHFATAGHGSLIAVGIIVEPTTGLIIDTHVSCKYCTCCKKERERKTEAEFDAWYETHHELCQSNFQKELDSDNTELEITDLLYRNSTDLGLRYTSFIDDDDDVAVYKKLCESKVYGDQYEIKKTGYEDHIGEMIYKHLEKLRTVGHLGGLEEGILTEETNKLLKAMYLDAYYAHLDEHQKMRDFIAMFIEHHASTDENPTHNACTPRWCKYKRETEQGKIPGPGWHRDPNNRKFFINEKVADELTKYFNKCTQENLLARITAYGEDSDEILRDKIWEFLTDNEKGVAYVKIFIAYVAVEHNENLKAYAIQLL